MLVAFPAPLPEMISPAQIAPEPIPARKRRRTGSRLRTALLIGMILIMDDGSACQIVAFGPDGQPLCIPIPTEEAQK